MAGSHLQSALKQRDARNLGKLQVLRQNMAELEKANAVIERQARIVAVLKDEQPNIVLEASKPRKPRTPQPRSGSVGRDPADKRIPNTQAILRVLRTKRASMTTAAVIEDHRTDYADVESALDLGKARSRLAGDQGGPRPADPPHPVESASQTWTMAVPVRSSGDRASATMVLSMRMEAGSFGRGGRGSGGGSR